MSHGTEHRQPMNRLHGKTALITGGAGAIGLAAARLFVQEAASPGAPSATRQRILSAIPLARYGTPEEVAQLLLFLASDESAFCTGGFYPVDGGRSAR